MPVSQNGDGLAVGVTYSGPLFTGDPGKTIDQNIRRAFMDMAGDTARVVRELVPVGPGRNPPGHLRDNIVAVDRSASGRQWELTAVVKSVLNLGMPEHIGYATYVETGVRKGTAVYQSGSLKGQRSGKLAAGDRARLSRKAGTFRGRGMFKVGAQHLRGLMARFKYDLAKGLN